MARLGRTIPNRPIIGRAQLIPVAAPPIARVSYVIKPVFTGYRPGRTQIIRRQDIAEAAALAPVARSQYFVKSAFTGRRFGQTIFGRYYRIQRVACPIEITLYNPAALAISLANPGNCSIGLANPGNCSISLEVCG